MKVGDRVRVTDERRADLNESQLQNCVLEGVIESVDPFAGFKLLEGDTLATRRVSFWDEQSLELVE